MVLKQMVLFLKMKLWYNEAGDINRIFLASSGGGYSKLPTATVSSVNGIDAKLVV